MRLHIIVALPVSHDSQAYTCLESLQTNKWKVPYVVTKTVAGLILGKLLGEGMKIESDCLNN